LTFGPGPRLPLAPKMLILPDRNAPVGRLLLPQRKNEWRTPSNAQRKDHLGNENQTRFRLTGRLHDGHIAWRGWFDDREDADAFLLAVLTGSILVERELWRLPTPNWHPDFGEHLTYEFATVTFITTTGAGTFTVPGDWNSATNTVGALGGGAGAGRGQSGVGNRSGGGGGAYSESANLSLTIGASISVQVGASGAGATVVNTTGGVGGDTWFNGVSLGAATIGAQGGQAGVNNATSTGGAAASGTGTTKKSGGSSTVNGGGGSGGGGGAGANGDGGAGIGDTAGSTANGGGGGGGGNGGSAGSQNSAGTGGGGGAGAASGGNGGAGGNANNGVGAGGLDGTNFDASHGSGGGGGGGAGNTGGAGATGGVGGSYGAGGGSGGPSNGGGQGNGAAGTQGLIYITYAFLITRLERGIRGLNRGITVGMYH
jgi:hypothetical protein